MSFDAAGKNSSKLDHSSANLEARRDSHTLIAQGLESFDAWGPPRDKSKHVPTEAEKRADIKSKEEKVSRRINEHPMGVRDDEKQDRRKLDNAIIEGYVNGNLYEHGFKEIQGVMKDRKYSFPDELTNVLNAVCADLGSVGIEATSAVGRRLENMCGFKQFKTDLAADKTYVILSQKDDGLPMKWQVSADKVEYHGAYH